MVKFTFTLGGQEFSLSADEVERKLKGVSPEEINRSTLKSQVSDTQ